MLIFDLDGTLSDPAEGIFRCFCHALEHFSHPFPDPGFIHRMIGPPLDQAFLAWLPDIDQTHLHALVARYRERYVEIGYRENTLYPGILDALSALSDRGVVMGVCTSKKLEPAKQVLAHFGLDHFFRFVSGGDIGVRKATQLGVLLENRDIDTRWLMIGDRHVDIEAAAENGLRGAGVLWGYGSRNELEKAGAARLIGRVEELSSLG